MESINKKLSKMKTYRSKFGLPDPPEGTFLKLKFMEGIKYYLLWEDCPDNENIVAGWFTSKAKALEFSREKGWKTY